MTYLTTVSDIIVSESFENKYAYSSLCLELHIRVCYIFCQELLLYFRYECCISTSNDQDRNGS